MYSLEGHLLLSLVSLRALRGRGMSHLLLLHICIISVLPAVFITFELFSGKKFKKKKKRIFQF